MFKKKEPKMFSSNETQPSPLDITGFIGKGMRIEGTMEFDGAGRIDGKFKGEIKGNGTLLVGEEAKIEGDISVNDAIVSGEIRGVLTAKSKVELRPPAKMLGDIHSPTLIINEGVVFEGNSVMTKQGGVAQIRPIASGDSGSALRVGPLGSSGSESSAATSVDPDKAGKEDE